MSAESPNPAPPDDESRTHVAVPSGDDPAGRTSAFRSGSFVPDMPTSLLPQSEPDEVGSVPSRDGGTPPPSAADVPTRALVSPTPITRRKDQTTPNVAEQATLRSDAGDFQPGPGGTYLPTIPGYEVLAEVGRGGMGIVYKARQLDLNRLVALKMVLAESYSRSEDLIRFRIEAEMAARVRHPNVVAVYDSGAHNGRAYLSLEWVDGGTLSQALAGRPQPPETAARTVELLARATHACHCHGVVHRDLKPGNVLLARGDGTGSASRAAVSGFAPGTTRRDGLSVTLTLDGHPTAVVPKITDFGLAKQLVGGTYLTQTGRVMGTPEYMAPEQAEGRTGVIGPATDTYALGIILYQMLVGRTPFKGDTAMVVLRRLLEEEPAPPRAANPKLPRDLETICLKCLEKDQLRRYPSAEAVADDLDCFLQGKPITARPAGPVERAWKWAARRPAVAALSAAALLFLVLGVAGVTWQWRVAVAARDDTRAAENVARTEKATTDAVNRFLVHELLETATPQKALGRQITVEEVLRNAAARVNGAFPEQPEVDASVRLALGNSFRKLGLYAEAARFLQAAVGKRRELLGPAHRDTLAAAADHAHLLADQSKWAEAIPLLRQVVADARANLGDDDPVTLETVGRLALVLQDSGDTGEAEGLFREALDRSRRAFGPADPRTLTVLNDLGMLLRTRKKLPDAEAAFREAADGRAKALADNHPATLESRHNLAVALDQQGRWAEAKPLHQQVLDVKRQVLGPHHADTLSAMNNLAHLHDTHGEPDAALGLYEEALEGFRAALGPDNPLTLKVLSNLGHLSFRMDRRSSRPDLKERALNALTAVREARRRVLPPNHPDTLLATNDLAVVLFARGDRAAAEPLMVEALEGRKKALSPGHPDTLQSADNYAQLLLGARQAAAAAKAAALLAEAWAAAETEKSSEHTSALGLLNTYVEALTALRKRDEALPLAERAAAALLKGQGEKAAATVRARRNLGGLLLDLNRPADAEPHLKAVFDAALTADGAQHSRTAQAAGRYGACLLAQKKFAEAEEPLVLSYRGLSQFRQAPPAVVKAACEQLVKLYEAWGKPEKADEYRAKLD